MKSKALAVLTGITFSIILAIPIRPAAQEWQQAERASHPESGTGSPIPLTHQPMVRDATAPVAEERVPTYTVLYTFTGGADGGYPLASVNADAAGNLYGTTSNGGNTSSSCFGSLGCGVVFKLDPVGNETVLHTFTNGTDGGYPAAGLVRDGAGNLYGTTVYGGEAGSLCFLYGCGVAFRLDPKGNETVLHAFTGSSDGANSYAALIRDAGGNLYGTTANGLLETGCLDGCGVAFKLDATGNETVLHTFNFNPDGAYPAAALIWDASGSLYGTAEEGGDLSGCAGFGCGTAFRLDATGKETLLHSFTGGLDGANPTASLIRDATGNLYGTTWSGGAYSSGVVFKLDLARKETVLHAFTGGADGMGPIADLIMDREGNLYGTTTEGGNTSTNSSCPFVTGCGVVFKLDPSGHESLLYSFTGGADGSSPRSGLQRDAANNLYGTTYYGGNISSACPFGCGVVFRLHMTGYEVP